MYVVLQRYEGVSLKRLHGKETFFALPFAAKAHREHLRNQRAEHRADEG